MRHTETLPGRAGLVLTLVLALLLATSRPARLGGLAPQTGPVSRVDVLDPETGAWSKGPDLPRGSMLGFGAAAASDGDRLFVGQADGQTYRLAEDGAAWEPVATLAQPRYMHRLIPVGTHLLAVGGAGREGHLATIEVVDVGASDRDPADRAGATRWAGFRGGRDTNVSRAARLPLTWSDDTVTWRATTPGFGQSSPVVILLTRRTYSYLLAVDPRTGETVWKTDREPGVAWSTPVLAPDGDEIVVSASGRIEGFDAGTGDLRWSFAGFRGNHVPSPTVTGDLVIIGGLAVEANLALRRGRTGALDRSDVAWTAGSASNFASPFAYRDCVYWVNPAGAARCLAPDSGTVRWTHRLPASTWATPLGHGDRVYFFTEQGVTQVLRYSIDAPEVFATNPLSVDAPVTGFAAVDDAIVIRAGTEVIRVGRSSD